MAHPTIKNADDFVDYLTALADEGHSAMDLAMIASELFTRQPICFATRFTEQTVYRWKKKKWGGLGVAEFRRLKQREEEKKKLKQFVADLSFDKRILQDLVEGQL